MPHYRPLRAPGPMAVCVLKLTMCAARQVRVLVRELRKQMDGHIIELAEELASDAQQQPKDPDGYVYKVDQSLLSSAVSPTTP